jgi:hypothetical protein
VAAGAGFGLANELSSQKDPTLKGAAIQAGVGGATGGVLSGLGALGGKVMNRLSGKGGNVVEKIVSETNPAKLIREIRYT